MIAERRSYPNREALATALARDVAVRLPGLLAVSGGSTPKLFLRALSKQQAEWPKTVVTLVDERQVPETGDRSNARFVRENLMQNEAAAARFEPLRLDVTPRPFAAVVLGMGTDGHTASFFPQGDVLTRAIDPAEPPAVLAMSAPGAGEPRLTFTLSALLDTRFLALHIEGEEKARVLDQALEDGPLEAMPIRAVLRGSKPLFVYWCP